MVEAGISAAAVFTEVKDRQLKPFTIKDSAGNPLSGVFPLNSRPVLGAGGFQVNARQPFNFASDRFSIAPEATFGLAWGAAYSTMLWSVTADAAINLLNGNARITGKLGYGGYKVESDTSFSETRHGLKAGLEGSLRLFTDLDFVSQAVTTLTPNGPQTAITVGFQWLFNKRPEPPVDLDGSLGRQSMAVAGQQLDHMDHAYYIPNAMVESTAGPGTTLVDRLQILSFIITAFIKNENFASLPSVDDELAKVQIALDNANNNGVKASVLSPVRKRAREFKETRYMEALKLIQEFLIEVEHTQCHKAAELAEAGDYEFAGKALASCIENLTMIQNMSATLEPVLPPIGKVEVSTMQRKLACLFKGEMCTSDIDAEKTVPAIQKKIKPASGSASGEPKAEGTPTPVDKPKDTAKPKKQPK